MAQILTTPRLTIREMTLNDWPFVKELVNTEGWLTNIGDRNIHDQASAEAYMQTRYIYAYETHGYGLWLVELIETQQPIGLCGLIKRDSLPDTDIGFAFLPRYIGKGFGKESAQAVLQHGFGELGLKKIIAITIPSNSPSIGLLRAIGMELESETEMDGEKLLVMASYNTIS
jgi:[ribosomal protein S5]-alanine N-acetyltransferase